MFFQTFLLLYAVLIFLFLFFQIVLFGFGLLFNAPLRTDFVNGGFTQWQPTQVVETLPPRLPVSEPEITSIAKASRASSSKGYDFPEWRIRKPLVRFNITTVVGDVNPSFLLG